MSMVIKVNITERWFHEINIGRKTVEGRLNKKQFKVGDRLLLTNSERRMITVPIVGVREYSNFEEYLRAEGLEKCLPGIQTLEAGVEIYHEYYSREDEEKYGVVAL